MKIYIYIYIYICVCVCVSVCVCARESLESVYLFVLLSVLVIGECVYLCTRA